MELKEQERSIWILIVCKVGRGLLEGRGLGGRDLRTTCLVNSRQIQAWIPFFLILLLLWIIYALLKIYFGDLCQQLQVFVILQNPVITCGRWRMNSTTKWLETVNWVYSSCFALGSVLASLCIFLIIQPPLCQPIMWDLRWVIVWWSVKMLIVNTEYWIKMTLGQRGTVVSASDLWSGGYHSSCCNCLWKAIYLHFLSTPVCKMGTRL